MLKPLGKTIIAVIAATLILPVANAAEPLDIEALVKGNSGTGTCFQGTTKNGKNETILYIAEHRPDGTMTVTFKLGAKTLVADGRYTLDQLNMCLDWTDPDLEDSCYKAINASGGKIRLAGDTGTWADGTFSDGACPK